MVRAFVALELSPEIRASLADSEQPLRTTGAKLSFVEAANIHITIKFLGEVDERKLPILMDALRQVTFTPFTVRAAMITVNNPNNPHTVWCTIEDNGESSELFWRIEDALVPLGFPRETRKFTPHATIARVKRADPSLLPAVNRLKNRIAGSCIVTGFRLKKSTLTPQGPVYEDLLVVTW